MGDALRALGEFPGSKKLCSHYVGRLDSCVHREDCTVRPVWSHIAVYLASVLDGLTLSDLLGSETSVRSRLESLNSLVVSNFEDRKEAAQVPVHSTSHKEQTS